MPFRRSSGAKDAGKHRDKAPSHAGSSPNAEPMDFWRSGTVRPYRQQPGPKKKLSLWKRMSGFYFPAWVPVVGIIVIVFGILGVLFITRSATGAPRNGEHWHANYQFFVCGIKQPNAPFWEAGVHTHGDGIVHIHPFQTYEEGAGARWSKWFGYGGGTLKSDEINMPGLPDTWHNGDTCTTADGEEQVGEVQLFVTNVDGETRQLTGRDIERYLPHDGDKIRLVFGPPEEVIQEEDRTVIPEEQATRTIDMVITDDGATDPSDPSVAESSARFEPATINVSQGETVKLVIKNTGSISHGFRVSGTDGVFDTQDDYVSQPEIILPNEEGFAVIRLDAAATTTFRNDTLQTVTGEITVEETGVATPTPTPGPEAVDIELDMVLGDDAYEPSTLTVEAGQKFRINLTNGGELGHNVQFAGPDGDFDTDDDILSDDLRSGATGELVGQFDEAGQYPFRDQFNAADGPTGVLTVE